MEFQSYIQKITEGQTLSSEDMTRAMTLIMTGEATPAQIGGFLIGLRVRGETVDEISAAAQVMRQLATPVNTAKDYLVDTCGTGGDASGTFNISTTSAFVAAAAGAKVAKHGNRAVSSKSGSADVLETLGININLTPEQVSQCIDQVGLGFLFAQRHHGAMKYAIGPRRELGVRTVFNVLGPLTNPAGAPNQVLGVFSQQWVKPLAQVLQKLGSRHVMVVHALDGLDEISLSSETLVAELKDGQIREYYIAPEDFGLQRYPLSAIQVHTSTDSSQLIHQVLQGESGAARDIVCLNAGAALYVAGCAASHVTGIELAQQALDSGEAAKRLQQLINLTQSFNA
ncbi:MAG: anthranilate phosphoribosyltransferase [Thiofilum sp.]|uniref:anthranilate phosphoribosyltransferase n=1 Tax=Thiofilum sp. TaxID=2212733 RepID=UPI0025F78932|nr:anthranilate phosphoribosyltransferase [Thiofilum sp.]MBK8454679.1 anthranilate phosphoribosyltransferase [Thiofilum sp.]